MTNDSLVKNSGVDVNLSDFAQLFLEPQNPLYNVLFTYAAVLSKTCKQTSKCKISGVPLSEVKKTETVTFGLKFVDNLSTLFLGSSVTTTTT